MTAPCDRRTSSSVPLVLATVILFSGTLSSGCSSRGPVVEIDPRRVVIDADTGNEIDDLFAIVRVLVEPRFEVVGLSSAQYHTQREAPENTVRISQRLNEEILRQMGMSEIPHPMGSNEPLTDPNRVLRGLPLRVILSRGEPHHLEARLDENANDREQVVDLVAGVRIDDYAPRVDLDNRTTRGATRRESPRE